MGRIVGVISKIRFLAAYVWRHSNREVKPAALLDVDPVVAVEAAVPRDRQQTRMAAPTPQYKLACLAAQCRLRGERSVSPPARERDFCGIIRVGISIDEISDNPAVR
jgi:hypothetical protein